MLVNFSTKAYADITMFGEIAVHLLKLMGHSGTVPGAILAEDVPEALSKLKAAIEANSNIPESGDDDDDGEAPVGFAVRAYPLVQLLSAAAEDGCDVMWDKR